MSPGTLKTSEGKVPVELPQVRNGREPFRSQLWAQMGKRTDVLERLAVELYARGLSTRDIEDAFESATGERLLSRSTVSEVTDSLWTEHEAFQQRDLSGFELECLFLDAVYESLRLQAGAKEESLCAWGILRDGRKVMLHMALGNNESGSLAGDASEYGRTGFASTLECDLGRSTGIDCRHRTGISEELADSLLGS